MIWFLLGLLNTYLLFSYGWMGWWFFWQQRRAGLRFIVRFGLWLLSPIFVVLYIVHFFLDRCKL